MKGNDGTGNISERDDWKTPQELWDKLNEQYNFQIDCCASKENTKCNSFYDLDIPFQTRTSIIKCNCWMNPPFSNSFVMFKTFFNRVKRGVAIYRCDNMETKIWQELILANADWVFIPKGRISYEGKDGKGSRFPSALIGKGLQFPVNIKGYLLLTYKRGRR